MNEKCVFWTVQASMRRKIIERCNTWVNSRRKKCEYFAIFGTGPFWGKFPCCTQQNVIPPPGTAVAASHGIAHFIGAVKLASNRFHLECWILFPRNFKEFHHKTQSSYFVHVHGQWEMQWNCWHTKYGYSEVIACTLTVNNIVLFRKHIRALRASSKNGQILS